MDPNATLQAIQELVDEQERSYEDERDDEIGDLCLSLVEWIDGGGFSPDWDKYPEATEEFDQRCIGG